MEPNAAMAATPLPDARFRLRTLFIATATCAAAFAIMVRWGGISGVSILAGCVPALWLGRGLVISGYALWRHDSVSTQSFAWLSVVVGWVIITLAALVLMFVTVLGIFVLILHVLNLLFGLFG